MADGDPSKEDGGASPAAEQKKGSHKPGPAAEQKHEQGNNSAATEEDKADEERNSRDQGLTTAPSDQAAAVLAMLASSCNQQHADAGMADADKAENATTAPAKRTSNSTADDSGRPAKLARTSSNADQQQGDADSGDAGAAAPDSPTGSDAVAAAASLHKLSSASAAELDGSLAAFRAAVAATERTNSATAAAIAGDSRGLVSAADAQLLLGGLRRIGSGMSNVPLGSGGPLKPGQSKHSPQHIMEGLVEAGLLQSYSPETHCYVKCGNVQGVFSLASGSILCLCNECSGNDPCWFAPAAFERHGGMAASKKWRGSIQVGARWLDRVGLVRTGVQGSQRGWLHRIREANSAQS